MSNKFENLFQTNRETTGPGKERGIVPVELKRAAVEAVATANVIEPQAFQLGAIKIADLRLQSEQQGLSRSWMSWLSEEDILEIGEALLNLKNKTHAQHGINPDPRMTRSQEEMYGLFKTYGHQSEDVLGAIEHHLGHLLDKNDIREILQWIYQQRLRATEDNAEYRTLLKTGDPSARRKLMSMYKVLEQEFSQSNLYREKALKLNDFGRRHFDFCLHSLFLRTFENS